MSWTSTSLKESLKSTKDQANILLNKLNEDLLKAQQGKDIAQTKYNEILNIVNNNNSIITSFEQTGINCIILSPIQGVWIDRLINAPSAPLGLRNDYSCVYASIAVSASSSSIEFIYKNILDATKGSVLSVKNLSDIISNISISSESIVTASKETFISPIDKWQNLTLKKIFPEVFNIARSSNNELILTLNGLNRILMSLGQYIPALQQSISALQSFIQDLENSGVFEVFLPPAIGSWNSRLLSESGAPPTFDQYSTGICFVASGPNLSDIQNKYNSMLKVIQS